MHKLRLLSGAVFLFLVACASQPVVFEPLQPGADKRSIVYVYRLSSLANSMISPKLLLNEHAVFELKNDSYQYNRVAPGKHIFRLDLGERFEGNKKITLNVLPNKTYFIRVTSTLRFEMNKPYTRSFNLQLVEPSVALHELASISAERKAQSSSKKDEIQADYVSEKADDPRFSIENTRNPFYK